MTAGGESSRMVQTVLDQDDDMSTVAKQYTPEDLLVMPDGDDYELVDGELVRRNMGANSSRIVTKAITLIGKYNEATPRGWLFNTDCGYQCFPDAPNKVRKPDVSFVCFGRFPNEQVPDGYIELPPDLSIEVLSPNDLDYETDLKVEELLAAGVRLIWVINPESHTVLVYRANGSIVGLREYDELSGEDVLPGFRCRVAELFAVPGAPELVAGTAR